MDENKCGYCKSRMHPLHGCGDQRLQEVIDSIRLSLSQSEAREARLRVALEGAVDALAVFSYAVPHYPGLSSHAMIPVHEPNNFWERWKLVNTAWDKMIEALKEAA